MSITNSVKSCTFSDTTITVLNEGQPVSNAKVIRRVEWNKEVTDEFYTDSSGSVSMPAMFELSVMKFIPSEFVSFQVIEVEIDGESVEVWNYAKRDSGLNSEREGSPLNLTCELTADESTQRVFGSAVVSRCTWK